MGDRHVKRRTWRGLGFALWLHGASIVSMPMAALCADIRADTRTTGVQETLELLREETLEPFELGELVPSARQRFGPISRTYEVSSQAILNQNARNVGEALRFVPGIIYGQGGTQNEGAIVIRGLGHRSGLASNDKLYSVFIDGRPVLEPFLGTVDLFNLPIDNVAKIKVVKGPAAAAFGPDNIGGVINIITKQGTGKPRTEATVSYEEHNTQDYWLQHGGMKGKFRYFLSGSIRKTNGFSLSSDFQPTALQQSDDLRLQSDFEKYNVSMNLGYDFTDKDKVALLAGYYQSKFGIPPPTTGYKAFDPEFGRFTFWQRYFVDVTGETQPTDAVTLKGKVYFDKFDNDLTFYTDQTFSRVDTDFFTGGNEVSVFDNFLLGSNLQASVTPRDDVTLKGGSFVRWDNVERQRDSASPFENFQTLTLDLFAEAEYFPIDELMLYAGINWDMLFTLESFFDRTDKATRIDAVSPIGSVIYKPRRATRLHVTGGKKSNLPRMQNLYGQRAGNLDVQPENNLFVEAGVTQGMWRDRLEAEATFFYNDADNIIELQDRTTTIFVPFPSSVEFANTDSYTTVGAELLLSFKWDERLATTLGYTYVNTDSEARGRSLDTRFTGETLDPDTPLLERPKHQVTLLADYRLPMGLGGYLQGSYQSESFAERALFSDPFPDRFDHNDVIKVQGRFLLNAKVDYEIWKGIKPFFMVENITDSNYEAIRGFQRPGRRFFFGVHAKM